MFEEKIPSNLPVEPTPGQEPEDMFAGVEKPKIGGVAPLVSAPKPPAVPSLGGPAAPLRPPELMASPASVKSPLISNPMVIWVAGIILGLAIVIAGGYGLARFLRQAQETPSTPANNQENAAPLNGVEENNGNSGNTVEILPPAPVVPVTVDSDGDGLTDEEEAQLGINPNEVDTDSDGLTDYEEVKVYATNPLNPDTDGDSFSDGQEVRNGYNPNGEGKLLELPQQ